MSNSGLEISGTCGLSLFSLAMDDDIENCQQVTPVLSHEHGSHMKGASAQTL